MVIVSVVAVLIVVSVTLSYVWLVRPVIEAQTAVLEETERGAEREAA